MKMVPDGLCCLARNNRGERFGRCLLHVAQAAEVGQQPLSRLRADAGNVQQFRVAVPHGAALAMIADGEAVALVADQLHQVQHRRTAVQNHWLIFIAVEVNDLLALGDRGQRLGGQAERFQSLGGGVKLAQTAIHQNQRGHGLRLAVLVLFFQ